VYGVCVGVGMFGLVRPCVMAWLGRFSLMLALFRILLQVLDPDDDRHVGAHSFVTSGRSNHVNPCLIEKFDGILLLGKCVYTVRHDVYEVLARRHNVWRWRYVDFHVLEMESSPYGR